MVLFEFKLTSVYRDLTTGCKVQLNGMPIVENLCSSSLIVNSYRIQVSLNKNSQIDRRLILPFRTGAGFHTEFAPVLRPFSARIPPMRTTTSISNSIYH